MKSTAEGTNGVAEPSKASRSSTISERKLKANRENAKKSTGPTTPRGKTYSRRNALKHGLFAKALFTDWYWPGEDPKEFYELLDSLEQHYQPVGIEEELEVQLIAVCRWRQVRAWRFENAEIRLAQAQVAIRGLVSSHTDIMSPQQLVALGILESAEKEIDAGNGMPKELEEQLFAAYPPFRQAWPELKMRSVAQEWPGMPKEQEEQLFTAYPFFRQLWSGLKQKVQSVAPKWDSQHAVVRGAIRFLVLESSMCYDNILGFGHDREGIPNREALDRLLRRESATDRALGRSLDRLERLQRQRLGGRTSSVLSVLTQ